MQLNSRDPYLKRVAIVAYRTLTMWRIAPVQFVALAAAFARLVVELLGMLVILALPSLFMFAPLYLWIVERVARNRAKQAADAAELQKWMQFAKNLEAQKGKE